MFLNVLPFFKYIKIRIKSMGFKKTIGGGRGVFTVELKGTWVQEVGGCFLEAQPLH